MKNDFTIKYFLKGYNKGSYLGSFSVVDVMKLSAMCFKDRKVCLCRPGNIHVTEEGMCKHIDTCSSDGQNTDPQSMEHTNGQPHANGLTL